MGAVYGFVETERNRMGIIDNLLGGLGYMKKGAGQSVLPAYLDDPSPKARIPKFSYPTLYEEAERNWVVQAGVQLLIREILRPGWNPYTPKFVSKCRACGSEYDKEVEKCPDCESDDIVKPDADQKKLIKRLMGKPNRNRETWSKLLYSICYHDLIADRWFMSVAYAPLTTRDGAVASHIPKEVYIEHPSEIQFVLDGMGRLGGAPYICPYCQKETRSDKPTADDKQYTSKVPDSCPSCGQPMHLTAYEQKIGDKTYNRFTDIEMIHGSTYRPSPDPDTMPRLVSAWQGLYTVKAMDEWFYDTYSEGILGKIIFNPTMTQESMNEVAQGVKSQLKMMDQIDAVSGDARTKKTARVLFLGGSSVGGRGAGEGMAVHNLIDDPTAMKAIEYYLTCVSAILSVFGVQAIYLNAEQAGKVGGAPAIKMDIQNHVIETLQQEKEDVINSQLYPIFGITDYVFKFNPLVQKDALVEAQIKQTIANTAVNLVNSGIDFDIDETWTIIPKGRIELPAPTQTRPDGGTEQKPQVSERSGQIIQGTTVQRNPHNPDDDNRGEPDKKTRKTRRKKKDE